MMKGLSLGLGEYSDKAGSVLGETPQFWTAPPVSFFSGQDSSWTRFTLGLGVTTVDIEIPHKWLTLIREILLWGIRIWFVGAVIKLLMA